MEKSSNSPNFLLRAPCSMLAARATSPRMDRVVSFPHEHAEPLGTSPAGTAAASIAKFAGLW